MSDVAETPATAIRPTCGRLLYFFDKAWDFAGPLPGVVIRAMDDGPGTVPHVNARVFGDPPTAPFDRQTWYAVPVYDAGVVPPNQRYAQWMDYQMKAAQKAG
jgi:hypothetical protein